MGNKLKYILLLLLGFTTLKGQVNLVPNPSFEICDSICNRNFFEHYNMGNGVITHFLQNWFSAKGSPDFMNPNNITDSTGPLGCWGGGGYSNPNSVSGFQYPRTDSCYLGIVAYAFFLQNDFAGHLYHYREWAGVRLTDTLKAGVCYEFTMYVSRGEKTNRIVSSIGAYFTADSLIGDKFSYPTYASPWPLDSIEVQVQHNPWETIYDTINWIPITGVFKAQGGEKYMYIGNLLKDGQYPVVAIDTLEDNEYCQISYYFIDDVSLYEIDEPCGVGINEIKAGQVKLYPNPTTTNTTFEYTLNTKSSVTITLIDATGRMVERINPGTQNAGVYKQTFTTENYPAGLYLVQLQAGGSSISKRLQVVK